MSTDTVCVATRQRPFGSARRTVAYLGLSLGLALSAAEPARANGFMQGFITNAAKLFNPDFCYNETLFAATAPSDCGPNGQLVGLNTGVDQLWAINALSACYDKCRPGYAQSALTCTQSGCPAGYRIEGAECVFEGQRTLARGRTACPAGYDDHGATCTRAASVRGKGCCEMTVSDLSQPRMPSQCAPGQTRVLDTCYEPCRSGYRLENGTCWLACPQGYKDIGELCSFDGPQIFTREMEGCPSGYVTEDLTCRLDYIVTGKPGNGCYSGGCPEGWNDQWCTCARNAHVFGRQYKSCPAGYDVFAASCIKQSGTIWKDRYLANWTSLGCAPGEVKNGGLCYPASSGPRTTCGAEMCQPGERNDGCVCSRDAHTIDRPSTPCPDGYYASTPDFCEKNGSRIWRDSYQLTPRRPKCPSGKIENNGLCYEPCLSQLTMPVVARVKRALIEAGIPERITGPGDLAKLILQRYVSGHGWVAFKGMGYTLANVIDPKVGGMFGYDKVRIDQPLLLMYRPEGTRSDAQLTDMVADYPYRLVGVGWMKDYTGTAQSNQLAPEAAPTDLDAYLPPGKFPQGAWFRHPAGCHMADGSFVAFRENEPASSNMIEGMINMLKGSAWCQAIGVGSTWKPDAAGALRPGTPGKCMLTRNFPATSGSPRPIVPGSFVRMKAPSPAGWPAAGNTTLVWQNKLRADANAACQKIGSVLHPPNLPTLWHPSLWVTHLFFDGDKGRVGILDTKLVPNGYEGPPESFIPLSNKLLPVVDPPPPPKPGKTPAGTPYGGGDFGG